MRFLVVFLVMSYQMAFAEPLTLRQFLQAATVDHPVFRQADNLTKIERAQQKAEKGEADWFLNLEGSYEADDRSSSTVSSYSIPFPSGDSIPQYHEIESKDKRKNVNLSLTKSFWDNGTRLQAFYSAVHNKTISYSTQVDEDGIPLEDRTSSSNKLNYGNLRLRYTIPLLKGAFGISMRGSYEIKYFDVKMAELIAAENKEEFLAELAMLFIEWEGFIKQRNLKMLQKNYLTKFLDMLQSKILTKDQLVLDQLRIQQQLVKNESDILEIESQIKSLSIVLSELSSVLNVMDKSPIINFFNIEVINKKNINSNRQLSVLQWQREQIDNTIKIQKNSLKPRLDFKSEFHISGKSQEDFENTFDRERQDYIFSINFFYPLGNTTAKAKLSQSRIEYQQNIDQKKYQQMQINADINAMKIELQKLVAILSLNEKQIEVEKEVNRLQQQAYFNEEVDLSIVLDSINQQYALQVEAINHRVGYQQQFIAYLDRTDQLYVDSVIHREIR